MKKKSGLFFCLLILATYVQIGNAQSRPVETVCNPMNLSYRFQLADVSRREAADPTVILFKGKYFLFASKTGGYWSSDNLVDWTFITSKDLPWEDYAPTAVVIKDTVYFMASGKEPVTIYKTADPKSGHWQVATANFPIGMIDPDLFLDGDGRLYFYYGCSNNYPTCAVELDRKTLSPIGQSIDLIHNNIQDFGWERSGDYNTGTRNPWLEGSWMNKYKGKYYLQYAAPATQLKSYADGLYIGDSPLGPFKVADNNPFSYKPEGFIAGAGHSTTFQDKWGNFWHIATMTISVKHIFERRLGLFPSFFDKDGMFYTYTGFGDFPHAIPQKRMVGPEDYSPSWMLLSYAKPVQVSSTLADHPAEYVTGENIRKYWSAKTGSKGEWVSVDLEKPCTVNAVQINFAEEGTNLFGRSDSTYYQYLLEYSIDGIIWKKMVDKTANRTDVPHDYIQLAASVKARYVRLTNYHVPDGKFAISGLRVFGKGTGAAPKSISIFSAVRDSTDTRNVKLSWQKSPGAIGYNIRFGTQPSKLYENYQVFATDTISIHSLSKLQPYYFSIDAFNENGITKGKKIQKGQ